MLLFILFLVTATGALSPQFQDFYHIEDELPNRINSNRQSKILGPNVVVNNIIQVGKPTNKQDYFVDDVDNVAEKGYTITNEGRQVVNGIAIQLRQVQRHPVVLLVEDNEQILKTANIYMNYIMKDPSVRNDFWLMKFNSSGVSSVLAKSATSEVGEFLGLLQNRQNGDTRRHLGHQELESGAVFFGILKATRQLPFGSGILLFVNSKVEDEDLAQLAIKETSNKQIRIFAVWQGSYPNINLQEQLIREATAVTHGAFFIGNTEMKATTNTDFMTVNGNANPVITHLTNLHGAKQLRVPIDEGVRAIHISLSNNINRAHFYTPQGYLIDLLNITDVARFALDSYVVKTGETFEIELAIAHAATTTPPSPTIGVWRLETDAFAQHYYHIIVSVRNDLTIETNYHADNQTGRIQLNVHGDYAKINDVTLITANGIPLNNKLKIDISQNIRNEDDIETFKPGSNVDIDVSSFPQEPVYIQVTGKDKRGHDFQRVSYFNPNNIHNVIQPTTITLGAGSELYQVPGRASNILYEVANNRDHVIFMRFEARDERRYLTRMSPLWAWINPHQTIVVTLTTVSQGDTDQITFSAHNGADRTDKNVIVRSGASATYDNESPHMWHKFTSNCHEVVFSSCEDHAWTIEVTAQDRETGLLLVTSSPEGLYFPNGYTSGTTEEVTGILSGSCCRSSVILTAIDAVNNRRTYVADAYWAPLGGGAIAAIILGVLILLALILLLIYCCVCGKCNCSRKQKDSMDLPRPEVYQYRGPANSANTKRY